MRVRLGVLWVLLGLMLLAGACGRGATSGERSEQSAATILSEVAAATGAVRSARFVAEDAVGADLVRRVEGVVEPASSRVAATLRYEFAEGTEPAEDNDPASEAVFRTPTDYVVAGGRWFVRGGLAQAVARATGRTLPAPSEWLSVDLSALGLDDTSVAGQFNLPDLGSFLQLLAALGEVPERVGDAELRSVTTVHWRTALTPRQIAGAPGFEAGAWDGALERFADVELFVVELWVDRNGIARKWTSAIDIDALATGANASPLERSMLELARRTSSWELFDVDRAPEVKAPSTATDVTAEVARLPRKR